MKHTLLLGALLISLIIAGCATITGGDNPDANTANPSDNTDNGGENTVRYAANGFSPQTITVSQGETVTWISEGPSMWVATDNHPSHRKYDGTSTQQHCNGESTDTFDACGAQQQYSFTFDKTGEWSYHNHVRPSHGGTVIVEK